MMDSQKRKIAYKYIYVKNHVIGNGFSREIDYYESININSVTEEIFLKEVAWVILSSGISERVVRRKYDELSLIFYRWSASNIIDNESKCRDAALMVFNNARKINAIIEISHLVTQIGFSSILEKVQQEGIEYLKSFPYIGEVTAYHLAKNLGLNYSKPDRHLCRIAEACGYKSSQTLCHDISDLVGDDEKIIDLVLWRYATLNKNYVDFFSIH